MGCSKRIDPQFEVRKWIRPEGNRMMHVVAADPLLCAGRPSIDDGVVVQARRFVLDGGASWATACR